MTRALFQLTVWAMTLWLAPAAASVAPPATHAEPPGWPWRSINMASTGSRPEDVRRLVERLGINSVHLQMAPEKLAQRRHLDADQAWQQSLAWVQAMLAACKAQGIVGIVEVSGVPLDRVQRNSQVTPQFWASDISQAAYLRRLESLARALHGLGAEFGAYDIMSEPVLIEHGRGRRPARWERLQPEIVRLLRAIDPERWIMVKPGPYGTPDGYRDFAPLDFPSLIYSVHMYDPHAFTHQGIKSHPRGPRYPGRIGLTVWNRDALERALAPVLDFQRQHHVPVYVGEFSAVRWAPGADAYLRDLVSIFNAHGWGWDYFTFGGWNGWNPDYNDAYPASAAQVKKQYVGRDSKRWATLRAIFPGPRQERP